MPRGIRLALFVHWKWVDVFRALKWVLVGGFAILSLVRCGQPICAIGFGDCEEMYKNVPNGAAASNTVPVVSISVLPPHDMSVGNPFKFGATGGTPCTSTAQSKSGYTWTVKPSDAQHVSVIGPDGTIAINKAGAYPVTAIDCSRPGGQAASAKVNVN